MWSLATKRPVPAMTDCHHKKAIIIIIIIIIIISPSVVKIPRAINIKLKSKVGMARGPVLHRQKQSSSVLRPNGKAVQ